MLVEIIHLFGIYPTFISNFSCIRRSNLFSNIQSQGGGLLWQDLTGTTCLNVRLWALVWRTYLPIVDIFGCVIAVSSLLRPILVLLAKVAVTSRWASLSALVPPTRTVQPLKLSKPVTHVKKLLPRMGWIWPFCVWTTLNLTRLAISTQERFVCFCFPILSYFWLLYPCCGLRLLEVVLSCPNNILQQVLCTSKTVQVPPIPSGGIPMSTAVSKSAPPPPRSTSTSSFPGVVTIMFPSPIPVSTDNDVIKHTSSRPAIGHTTSVSAPQPTELEGEFPLCDEL